MKANELRIGNLVIESLSFGSDKIITVDLKIFNRNIDEFNPIPLTEEWLSKFGFEGLIKDCRTLFKKGKFKVELSSGGNVYYDRNIFISSVHQLQNLYFALTGEELTFKSE